MQHLHGETAHGKKQHTTTHAAPEPDDAIRQAQSAEPEEREQVIRQTAYAFYEARGPMVARRSLVRGLAGARNWQSAGSLLTPTVKSLVTTLGSQPRIV